jgi:hypothetical protein
MSLVRDTRIERDHVYIFYYLVVSGIEITSSWKRRKKREEVYTVCLLQIVLELFITTC